VVITRETNLKINNKFAGEVLAEVTRDGVVESLHLGHLVALNADGSVFISVLDHQSYQSFQDHQLKLFKQQRCYGLV
jgi:L-asparaginase II